MHASERGPVDPVQRWLFCVVDSDAATCSIKDSVSEPSSLFEIESPECDSYTDHTRDES